MNAIEKEFETTERFELFTGSLSEKNIYFYKKLGYEIYREEVQSEKVTLVFMEKIK